MIKLLQCEKRKTRGRYVFLTALIITAAELVWALYNKYTGFMLENGWLAFLYQLPLVNAIFMPILSIIVSSRLCDIEHKGAMLKQLAVTVDKGKIYDAKFVCGLSIVLFCNIISWIAVIIGGYVKDFYGSVPIKLYLLYLMFTVIPTIAVYIFQHILSLLFKNQAVTFFAGIIGTFGGLFSMFLPNVPFLRNGLIWGWYGAMQFVGLFGWTKETRYDTAYFEVMDINWILFVIMIAACIIMYLAGKKLFCRKEL